jgi:hypothetical protein
MRAYRTIIGHNKVARGDELLTTRRRKTRVTRRLHEFGSSRRSQPCENAGENTGGQAGQATSATRRVGLSIMFEANAIIIVDSDPNDWHCSVASVPQGCGCIAQYRAPGTGGKSAFSKGTAMGSPRFPLGGTGGLSTSVWFR